MLERVISASRILLINGSDRDFEGPRPKYRDEVSTFHVNEKIR